MEDETVSILKNELEHIQKDVKELKDTQKDILKELSRYKGIVGGAMFTFSALVASATLIYRYVVKG